MFMQRKLFKPVIFLFWTKILDRRGCGTPMEVPRGVSHLSYQNFSRRTESGGGACMACGGACLKRSP